MNAPVGSELCHGIRQGGERLFQNGQIGRANEYYTAVDDTIDGE